MAGESKDKNASFKMFQMILDFLFCFSAFLSNFDVWIENMTAMKNNENLFKSKIHFVAFTQQLIEMCLVKVPYK